MLKPPDTLPDSLWSTIGYAIVILGSFLMWWLNNRPAKKPEEAAVSHDAVIKEYLEGQIVELRQDMASALAERDARLAALEDSDRSHKQYAEWLVQLGLPKPPFLTYEEYLAGPGAH